MVANASLYLQDLPLPLAESQGKKIVILTSVTSSGSASSGSGSLTSQDVAAALAAMTEGLLSAMDKMLQYLSQESQQNASANQINTAAASQQATKEVNDLKAQQKQEHSFWHKLGAFLLKYILGPVLAALTLAVTIWFCGPAAFVIAAAVLIATMIPVHNGQGMLASAVNAAVGALGKACGWSQATINIIEGVVNLIVGILVGIATGFVTTAATAAEVASTAAEAVETAVQTVATSVAPDINSAVSTAKNLASTVVSDIEDATSSVQSTVIKSAENVTDDAASTGQSTAKSAEDTASTKAKEAAFKAKIGRMTGINSGASVITSSNCFNDIVYGACVDAGVSDAESQEIASIIGMIMNLAVMAASIGYGIKSAGNLAEDATEIKPASLLKSASKLFGEDSAITKMLASMSDSSTTMGSLINKFTPTSVQQVLRAAELGTGGASAAANGLNGWAQQSAASLASSITKHKGEFAFIQGTGNIISEITQMASSALSDALKKFDALEKAPNYSAALFSEAKEMLQA